MTIYNSSKKRNVPVLNWNYLVIHKLSIRNFLGDFSKICIKVFDEANINQPVGVYYTRTDFYAHQNYITRTQAEAIQTKLKIPKGITYLVFEIEEDNKEINKEFEIEYSLTS